MLLDVFAGFTFLPARDFLDERRRIPDVIGVYALFVKGVEHWLHQPELSCEAESWPEQVGEFLHLYTGESCGIRSRVRDHLCGDISSSNFRETALAVQAHTEGTSQAFRLDQAEANLTETLINQTQVAFKAGELVRDLEREILQITTSPFNIAGRAGSRHATALKNLRARFRAIPEVAAFRSVSASRGRPRSLAQWSSSSRSQ